MKTVLHIGGCAMHYNSIVIAVQLLLATLAQAQLQSHDPPDISLTCLPKVMDITVRTSRPFYGRVTSLLDTSCFVLGDGNKTTTLELPLQGCGTFNDSTTLFYGNRIQVQQAPDTVDPFTDPIKDIECYYTIPVPPVIPAKPDQGTLVEPAVATAGLSERDILILVSILAFLTMLSCCCGWAYYCIRKRGIKVVRVKKSPPTSYAGSDITAVTSAGRITLVGVDVPSRPSTRMTTYDLSEARESPIEHYTLQDQMSTGYDMHSSSEGYSSAQWISEEEERSGDGGSPVGSRHTGPLSLPRPIVYDSRPSGRYTDMYTKETRIIEEEESRHSYENRSYEQTEVEREMPPQLPSRYDPSIADDYETETFDSFDNENVIVKKTKVTTVTEEREEITETRYDEISSNPPPSISASMRASVQPVTSQPDETVKWVTYSNKPPSIASSIRDKTWQQYIVEDGSVVGSEQSSLRDKTWQRHIVDRDSTGETASRTSARPQLTIPLQLDVDNGREATNRDALAQPQTIPAYSNHAQQEASTSKTARDVNAGKTEFEEFDPGAKPWSMDLLSPDPNIPRMGRSPQSPNNDLRSKFEDTRKWLETSLILNENSAESAQVAQKDNQNTKTLQEAYNAARSHFSHEMPSVPGSISNIDEARSLSEAVVLDVLEKGSEDTGLKDGGLSNRGATSSLMSRTGSENMGNFYGYDDYVAGADKDQSSDAVKKDGGVEKQGSERRFIKNETSRGSVGTGRRYKRNSSYAGSCKSSDLDGIEDEMRSVSECHVSDGLELCPEPDYDYY